MINKERYLSRLTQALNEHYTEIKRKGTGSKERQQYIDGYISAARALDAFDYDELKDFIDRIYVEVFGMTIEVRRSTSSLSLDPNDDEIAVPTFIRKGILLEMYDS